MVFSHSQFTVLPFYPSKNVAMPKKSCHETKNPLYLLIWGSKKPTNFFQGLKAVSFLFLLECKIQLQGWSGLLGDPNVMAAV